jgi:HAMP domain-containing protein
LMIAAALLVAGIAIAGGSMMVVVLRVSRPLTLLSRIVQRLAANDTAAEIPQIQRNDELGTMAGALAVFKANMIDAQRLRDEQLANEERQAEQRKKELVKLADGFESVIGEIVETVTVSSGDLERSAGSLSATAARSQELTTIVTAASGMPQATSKRWQPRPMN